MAKQFNNTDANKHLKHLKKFKFVKSITPAKNKHQDSL